MYTYSDASKCATHAINMHDVIILPVGLSDTVLLIPTHRSHLRAVAK